VRYLTFKKKDVIFKRNLKQITTDLYSMVQAIEVKNEFLATIITTDNWILTKVLLQNCHYQFYVDDSLVVVSDREFLLFIPSFSVVQFLISPGMSFTFGYSSPLPGLASHPLVATGVKLKAVVESGFKPELLKNAKVISVTRCSKPSALGLAAKKLIDSSLLASISLGMVAHRLNTSPEVLSRTFRRDFGLTPIEYRSRVRINSAINLLVNGANILETAFDVGFNDLSRFYKQFQKITALSPGKYKL